MGGRETKDSIRKTQKKVCLATMGAVYPMYQCRNLHLCYDLLNLGHCLKHIYLVTGIYS